MNTYHLPALIGLLVALLQIVCMVLVGRARGVTGIKAPAVTGHPDFERAYRVQMNTLEQSAIFLPLLYLANYYGNPLYVGIAGLVWLVGRVWYMVGYLNAADKRGMGFMVGAIGTVAMLVLATIGVATSLFSR
jgi:glutathione S-transferase